MRISTIILLKVLLLITLKSVAQQGIKGTIYDKNTRSPLSGASITIYTADKSIAKAQATTDEQGHFIIANPPAGNYNLIISYIGYKSERMPITVTNKVKTYSLDPKHTGLLPNAIKLATVNIKGNKPLITIRKDTIEFSASDFYTAENASLKNLLEKIPGLMVDLDGSFYFQGKKINDLYIDGRSVFSKGDNGSGDPKELSQLLQANIVDKIQLADKRGLDGLPRVGNSEKVINITIRKENKKGVNGKIGAGYGTNDIYAGNANVNMFRNNKMILSDVAVRNNNTFGSVGDREEFAVAPPLSGLTTMKFIRASGAFDLTPAVKLNPTISANNTNNKILTQTDRTNILPDSVFHYNSANSKTTDGKVLSYGIKSDIKLDERSTLNVSLNGAFIKDKNELLNTFSTTGKNTTDTINKGRTFNTSTADKNTYAFRGFYTRAFKKPGRQFFLNLTVNHRGNVEDQHNFTLNEVSQLYTADTINQQIHIKTTNNEVTIGPTYREQLSKSLTLSVNYLFNNSLTRNEQYAYDFDYYKMGYTVKDDMLTYIFKNTYFNHYLESGLTYNKDKIMGILTLGYNLNKSSSINYSNNNTFEETFHSWAPSLGLSYKISNSNSLSFFISNSSKIPQMESLIPVISTADPLYITLGNPDLKPTNRTGMSIEYAAFSEKGTVFGFKLFSEFEKNGLGNTVYSDSIGRQITKPINVSGNFSARSELSIGKRFNKAALSINYNLTPGVNRNSNYINDQNNITTAYEIIQRLNATWNHKKDLEASIGVFWGYVGNRYSIQNNYMDFLQYNATVNLNAFLPLDINIGTAYIYGHNTAQNESNQLLNAWIAKTWLADKSLQTKFSCFDILRQYKSFNTTQNYLYIEQVNTNTLTQYFMGSLTWYFGKKKKS